MLELFYKKYAFKEVNILLSISIITASYNYENYIKETIESVIAQTYKNWELIIVDDGSTDNSVSVIKSYCKKDDRIKLYTHENNINKGLKDTLLLGLEKAKNDFVVFLESDDTITPDYLEKKVKIIKENPNVKFIINDVNLMGEVEEKNRLNKHFKITDRILKSAEQPLDLSCEMYKLNYIVSFSVVMCDKNIFTNLDFDTPIKPLLDYYLWCQILRNYKVYYINEKLTNWRLHKNSYISDMKNISVKQNILFDIKKYEFLYKNKNNLIYYYNILFLDLKYYWKYFLEFRRKFIKIHMRDSEIYLMGKRYRLIK